MEPKELPMQITIHAMYDDKILIEIHDKTSNTQFLKMEMTREQFINATMNRLAYTEIKKTVVHDIEKVGKKHEHKMFEFPMPPGQKSYDVDTAVDLVKKCCPYGWTPDVSFSNQGSFFKKKDGTPEGTPYARTVIRRWVDQ